MEPNERPRQPACLHPPAGRGGSWRVLAAALVPLSVVLLAGCGGGKGDVEGQVTYQGKPLHYGRITFVSQVGDKPSLVSKIKDGHYHIKGCPAGPAQITVESIAPPRKGRPILIPQAKGFTPPEDEDAEVNPAKPAAIPPRYTDPEHSGLDYTVTAGAQTHDIPLNP